MAVSQWLTSKGSQNLFSPPSGAAQHADVDGARGGGPSSEVVAHRKHLASAHAPHLDLWQPVRRVARARLAEGLELDHENLRIGRLVDDQIFEPAEARPFALEALSKDAGHSLDGLTPLYSRGQGRLRGKWELQHRVLGKAVREAAG